MARYFFPFLVITLFVNIAGGPVVALIGAKTEAIAAETAHKMATLH